MKFSTRLVHALLWLLLFFPTTERQLFPWSSPATHCTADEYFIQTPSPRPSATLRRLPASVHAHAVACSQSLHRLPELEPSARHADTADSTDTPDTVEDLPAPPSRTFHAMASEAEPVWWNLQVMEPIFPQREPCRITLELLLLSALEHSAHIDVISDIPLIRESSVIEAEADFDWTNFVESRWNDISEPVGSLLTTNADRYSDENVAARLGVRRRNTWGGEIEAAQQFGHQTTNSPFFRPPNQGNSRLTLSYRQPLMRGAGETYNTSVTVLAKIESTIAADEFSRQLQTRLVEITQAYWELYRERGMLLQRRRLHENARIIQETLRRREQLDALQSQIVRADAAVARRWAEIVRAETTVRNAESRIRALVNDPGLGDSSATELIPGDSPAQEFVAIHPREGVALAFRNRPEIDQALQQIKSASVRCRIAQHEVLPILDVILETYASGLRGGSDVGQAWVDQFAVGEPSYSIGLQYERPFHNRAALARHQRRRVELRQLQNQFRATLELLKMEVEVAGREITTSYYEIGAKHEALRLSAREVVNIQDRWELLPGDDRSASLMLEDLLEAQQRLAAAEFEYLDTVRSFNVAQTVYEQVTGTLLQSEGISFERYCAGQLPHLELSRER